MLAAPPPHGDPDGAVRRALAAFPFPDAADEVLHKYYLPGGRAPGQPYARVPRPSLRPGAEGQRLAVVAAFAEVWLARQGHDGVIGINCLEKAQMSTPAVLYGAMLADVDVVLMGAGIPRDVPHLLDELAAHHRADLPVDVLGSHDSHVVGLDAADLFEGTPPTLRRPAFLAIVSADILATHLAKDDRSRPDGFVVEGPCAGGHNAPARGRAQVDGLGQPVFGPRDDADLARVAATGLPFWLAGGYGTPETVAAALATGAAGVQVGTVFALCTEAGTVPDLRGQLLALLQADALEVRTDARVSPTGFPFKVAQVPGTASDPALALARKRVCDLGYLRRPYLRPTGTVGYQCPAEPVEVHVRKGGTVEETAGRGCLCNSLLATIGLGQVRDDGGRELPLVTLGTDLDGARRLAAAHPDGWTAREVMEWLTAGTSATDA